MKRVLYHRRKDMNKNSMIQQKREKFIVFFRHSVLYTDYCIYGDGDTDGAGSDLMQDRGDRFCLKPCSLGFAAWLVQESVPKICTLRHAPAPSPPLCRRLPPLSPQPQSKVPQIFAHLPKPPYLCIVDKTKPRLSE